MNREEIKKEIRKIIDNNMDSDGYIPESIVSAAITDFFEQQMKDYEEVLADHRRLVRQIDVILNGEEGAAKQASLCDLVGQISSLQSKIKQLEQEKDNYGKAAFEAGRSMKSEVIDKGNDEESWPVFEVRHSYKYPDFESYLQRESQVTNPKPESE